MTTKSSSKLQARVRRKVKIRKRIRGTDERPRLCVYRSNRYTYVQLISDESSSVLGAASTKSIPAGELSMKSVDSAKLLGKKIAEIAESKSISQVVFDRNGYRYHGRVSAVAEGAREGGLKF